MLFTNRQRPESLTINIDNNVITEITETKFLGVMVDNQLNQKARVKLISSKISKSIAIL